MNLGHCLFVISSSAKGLSLRLKLAQRWLYTEVGLSRDASEAHCHSRLSREKEKLLHQVLGGAWLLGTMME